MSLPQKSSDVSSAGDEVQKRFRYQYLYTVLLSVQMYQGTIPYEELFCELNEDILAVLPSKKLVPIQIKTRESSRGPFGLRDDSVKQSLRRFITLNNEFPNSFEEFIFVSNIGFKPNSDLTKLIEQIKIKKTAQESNHYDEFIDELVILTSTSREKIVETLSKTKCQIGPGLDDIGNTVLKEHLSKISHCSQLSVSQLEAIQDNFVFIIFKKCSKVIEDSVSQYSAFVKDGETKKISQEIESKRITKSLIEKIAKEGVNNIYLVSKNLTSISLKVGSIDLMQAKMNSGGINILEIRSMENLAYSAETYFLEKYHRNNGSPEIRKQIEQIQVKLLNEAAEANTDCNSNTERYGEKMLANIENRLRKIVSEKHEDVFQIPYEILKGVIGILAGDCKVYFSKKIMGISE